MTGRSCPYLVRSPFGLTADGIVYAGEVGELPTYTGLDLCQLHSVSVGVTLRDFGLLDQFGRSESGSAARAVHAGLSLDSPDPAPHFHA
ncbi:hypothetical protein, partial [Streptomyces sp. 039-1]|uniref:hypothetical protein n=1 Tax=Streptomyces sp. 039-1 TaxID=2789263 RepID=UPI0039F61EB4